MTPEGERPTGWVIRWPNGALVQTGKERRHYLLCPSMASADAEADARGIPLHAGRVEPLWSRPAWEAEMARLALARGE